jgi:outer membrane protein assembly factor BamE
MPLKTSCRRIQALASLGGAALLLGGCSSMSGQVGENIARVITPYRVEVVQGNVITREQLAAIKPGLSREQVRQALGAPLLTDPFHAQRWDYVFLIRRPGTEAQQRSVVITFDGDAVKTIDAPELPTEIEFVASISARKPVESERKLELTSEEKAALPAPTRAADAAAAAPAVPLGAVRAYPPLEP